MTISSVILKSQKSKSFTCLNHITRTVGNAQFIENGQVNESAEPQKVNIQETLIETSKTNISS